MYMPVPPSATFPSSVKKYRWFGSPWYLESWHEGADFADLSLETSFDPKDRGKLNKCLMRLPCTDLAIWNPGALSS